MSLHIGRFVEKLAGAEARNLKELILPIADARALHQDITRLLLALEETTATKAAEDNTVEVVVKGGSYR